MKLSALAEALGASLDGAGEAEITGVAAIESAQPGQITFVSNPRYAGLARTTKASAVLVEPGFPAIAAPTLRVDNPYLAFARAVEVFYQPPACPPGIHRDGGDRGVGTDWSAGAHRGVCRDRRRRDDR